MKKYSDKEVNRLLAAADDLLADIQLYETPEEEQRRKQKEELRKQEEAIQHQTETEFQPKAADQTGTGTKTVQPKTTEDYQPEAVNQTGTGTETVQPKTTGDYQPEEVNQTETGTEAVQPEAADQTEMEMSEEICSQEEVEQQVELRELVKLEEAEALRRLEEIRRQEAIRQQEEARQLKRMRWRELNGQIDTSESQEERKGEKAAEPEESSPEKSESVPEERQADPLYLKQEKEQQEPPVSQLSEEAQQERGSDYGRMKQPNRMWVNVLFVVISMIYLELLTHFGICHNMGTTVVYPVLFAAGLGCIVTVIASFLPGRWNTIIVCAVLILGGLYCDLQLLSHAVAGTFLTLTGLPAGIRFLAQDGDALLQGFTEVLPFQIFMFLPVLLWVFVGREWIRFERSTWFNRLLAVSLGCILVVISILCLDLHGYDAASPYVCAYRFDSDTLLEPAGEQLGMAAMTVLELLELFSFNSL